MHKIHKNIKYPYFGNTSRIYSRFNFLFFYVTYVLYVANCRL